METKVLTHVKKLRDPHYFGAFELITGETPEGKAITIEMELTIVKAVREKTKTADATEKMVVYFEEVRPMIFNSINTTNTIKALGTAMEENWHGRKITVYVENIYNRMVKEWQDVVRVRPTPPIKQLPEMTPAHPRWAGAKKAMTAGNTTIEAIKEKYRLTPENEAALCQK